MGETTAARKDELMVVMMVVRLAVDLVASRDAPWVGSTDAWTAVNSADHWACAMAASWADCSADAKDAHWVDSMVEQWAAEMVANWVECSVGMTDAKWVGQMDASMAAHSAARSAGNWVDSTAVMWVASWGVMKAVYLAVCLVVYSAASMVAP